MEVIHGRGSLYHSHSEKLVLMLLISIMVDVLAYYKKLVELQSA